MIPAPPVPGTVARHSRLALRVHTKKSPRRLRRPLRDVGSHPVVVHQRHRIERGRVHPHPIRRGVRVQRPRRVYAGLLGGGDVDIAGMCAADSSNDDDRILHPAHCATASTPPNRTWTRAPTPDPSRLAHPTPSTSIRRRRRSSRSRQRRRRKALFMWLGGE